MAQQPVEPRVTVDLPVRVYGMSVEGRAFTQAARAQNISSEGALLTGIESALKVGDVVGVQCEDKKARCTVVWVMNVGIIKQNQVGVKVLSGQECPWKAYLPIERATIVVAPQNRRRYPRHKISLPLELHEEHSATPMRINATDVSGNGCYVETILPLPVGTMLRVEFWLDTERINITAVVRTCDPGVGNGVEFIGLPVAGKERMQAYLDAIDPQMGVTKPKPT